ncbi:MAG: hypothetical protein ACYCWN_11350 [Ferrimicrobium sp.]|uniref:DUF4233 domain-containing protein n=1 Tax=Ferrimicrobium acidiphilum TaxID=121039 RepID=A0ABV3Y1M5_9ACTN|nr:hypothetical protein [Ferrimicrobium sp.]
MAAPLSKRERQIGFGIVALTAVAYIAIWTPVIIGKVKPAKNVSFLNNPAVAITEGLLLMAITAFMIYRNQRRFAGVGAVIVALGAGWGTLVLLAFPLMAWGVFVGFKVDRAQVELRRQARLAKKSGLPAPSASGTNVRASAPRPRPSASKRYTPPKPPSKREARRRRNSRP